jgi:hypothetical protein
LRLRPRCRFIPLKSLIPDDRCSKCAQAHFACPHG